MSKDNAINSDEKELRDKLVSKLKQKEIDKMEQCGENLRQSCLYSDDSMEDISEEDLDVSNYITIAQWARKLKKLVFSVVRMS